MVAICSPSPIVEPAMNSHPSWDTGIVTIQHSLWLFIAGSFEYKMSFWVVAKWSPIGG